MLQYSFHPSRKKPLRSFSVATAAHLTQHFPVSVALGCVNDCKHIWSVHHPHCINLSERLFLFFSPLIEASFLRASATSKQVSTLTHRWTVLQTLALTLVNLPQPPKHPHMPTSSASPLPPRCRPPPPVSVVPLKNKRTKRERRLEKAVFLLLFHT